MAESEQAKRLVAIVDPDFMRRAKEIASGHYGMRLIEQNVREVVKDGRGELRVDSRVESPVTKGEDRYKTTIGFLDVKTKWWVSDVPLGTMVVEVKVKPTGVGDIIRQINLYREYVQANAWILASCFDLDAGQVATLEHARIKPIRLGDGFAKWFEERSGHGMPKLEQF